jgi:Flp pilus assembly protein protease CpaA
MSLVVVAEGGGMVDGDAVEGGVCRIGGGAVVVAVLAWRRRSMRLRATWARHLCRTKRSIFEYLNIDLCF